MIAVGDPTIGLGFEETGIVAAYTRPLKELRVHCFYLSTFAVDMILIPGSQTETVLTRLQSCVDKTSEVQVKSSNSGTSGSS